jgi:hypothetical protein
LISGWVGTVSTDPIMLIVSQCSYRSSALVYKGVLYGLYPHVGKLFGLGDNAYSKPIHPHTHTQHNWKMSEI